MRIFNLISSWLLWLLCAFYATAVVAIRVLDTIPRQATSPEKLSRLVQIFWLSLAMFTAFAAAAYLTRRQIWFARRRSVGLGYWALTVFFYFSVLGVTAAGFAPYFSGDRSLIQWASCALGAMFVVIGFPRLPDAPVSLPPPLPANENKIPA